VQIIGVWKLQVRYSEEGKQGKRIVAAVQAISRQKKEQMTRAVPFASQTFSAAPSLIDQGFFVLNPGYVAVHVDGFGQLRSAEA
jgi:hypothetical protein